MIFDGFWKSELQHYKRGLRFWCSVCHSENSFAAHQVNKYLLYSAAIIRKLVDDEREIDEGFQEHEMRMPKLALVRYDLPVWEYMFNGDKESILHTVVPKNYQEESQATTIEAKFICNFIIHSYIWNLVYGEEAKGVVGFLTASDRDKESKLYFVKIDDWINYIKYCKEKSKV